MDYEKKQEIPFGAFDSELMHQEINIPEGFEATVEGNKIVLKKTESEDEKIRKDIRQCIKLCSFVPSNGTTKDEMFAWLEQQKDFDKKLEKAYKANSEEIFNYGYKAAKAEMGRPDDMDTRWKYAYELIIADDMYQMSMNDEMVEEARTKASEALHKIVGDLLSSEKQCEKSLNFEAAEKEKYDFVSGQFIECRKSFNDFKEDNSYWLEYIGDDNYIGRSDNVLNQKFHITPRQLFTLFTVEHCPKNDENDEYNESEEDSLREELTKHLRDGAEGYIPAGSSEDYTRWLKWLEKQGEQKPVISDDALREGIAHFGITQYQIDNWLNQLYKEKEDKE